MAILWYYLDRKSALQEQIWTIRIQITLITRTKRQRSLLKAVSAQVSAHLEHRMLTHLVRFSSRFRFTITLKRLLIDVSCPWGYLLFQHLSLSWKDKLDFEMGRVSFSTTWLLDWELLTLFIFFFDINHCFLDEGLFPKSFWCSFYNCHISPHLGLLVIYTTRWS